MALLLIACIHQIQIQSTPPGAMLSMDGERVGATPENIKIPMFRRPRLTVALPGYRSLTFRPDMRVCFWDFIWEGMTFQWRKSLGRRSYGTMEVILIEEHPSYGTVPETTEE